MRTGKPLRTSNIIGKMHFVEIFCKNIVRYNIYEHFYTESYAPFSSPFFVTVTCVT